MAKQKPEKVFRIGYVSASVFRNKVTRGKGEDKTEREFLNVVLQRSYQDDKGDWQYSSQFSLGDSANVQRVLALAQAYLESQEAEIEV